MIIQSIYTLLLVLTGINLSTTDTIPDPIKWSFTVEKVSDLEYVLVATADIQKNWYLYSQYNTDEGPVPTSFTFSKSPTILMLQNVKEEGKAVSYTHLTLPTN